jgi:hypothetical protein
MELSHTHWTLHLFDLCCCLVLHSSCFYPEQRWSEKEENRIWITEICQMRFMSCNRRPCSNEKLISLLLIPSQWTQTIIESDLNPTIIGQTQTVSWNCLNLIYFPFLPQSRRHEAFNAISSFNSTNYSGMHDILFPSLLLPLTIEICEI